ncbi:MAG TPA: ATP-binding protein [Longimicrobiaceae bacterium]|nr:ATP-binding protein [Longimicrobiaceae bacterium]
MSTARQIVALLKSHVEGDDAQFLSVAMQVAAQEARQGHAKLAQELRALIDQAKERKGAVRRTGAIPLAQPKGELATLLSVAYPEVRLSGMVLPPGLESRLRRVLREQKQQNRLRDHGLAPRRKLLLLGPPGSGKTMTAAALAGELALPLFTILLEGVITKFMGETAAKLRAVFDAMGETRGVYLFDEFDAIGARRASGNDVGEIRRVLNSFLQFLEQDESFSLVIAATNHPELLDPALFRRFDDVIEYSLPDAAVAHRIMEARLATFHTAALDWSAVTEAASGMSQAEIARAADEAAKTAVLDGHTRISTPELLETLAERRRASR